MNDSFAQKNVLVTGGAGFIGSHLTDRLLEAGAKVTVIDNLITGFKENLAQALQNQNCTFINADVTNPPASYLPENETYTHIFHLASVASPVGYMKHPIETYQVNSHATHLLAQLAHEQRAMLLYTSTSEAYGDPLEHPQKETYWGNVNPVGPRACYDVSKRFGEMVIKTFIDLFDLNARTVRIFNTYGPRMDLNDGRVIPNFINQAINHQPLTIHGSGSQTRSFCYVDDLVEYLLRTALYEKARHEIINIGNPEEISIEAVAEKIALIVGNNVSTTHTEARNEDIAQRKPDISKAQSLLEYTPQISLDEGLQKTLNFYQTKKS